MRLRTCWQSHGTPNAVFALPADTALHDGPPNTRLRAADAGLRVGHRRETQTRGVWLWDRPIAQRAVADPLAPPGSGPPAAGNVSLVFFDTEGFESTGQSDAYDDRIFAFAAVVASTLVYNLAEAVRESDIEKLSFAVELAAAFFPRYNAPGSSCASHYHRRATRA